LRRSLYLLLVTATPVQAQTVLDRVDPARVEKAEQPATKPATDAAPPSVAAPATAAVAGPSVMVGAIMLSGLEALRPADFADVVEAHVGRTLSPDQLAGLADAVAERARARGYAFATAGIAPQRVAAGVLRVEVDEGRVDELRLGGVPNDAVRAALQPLVGQGPVRLDDLERRLLIAGDIDGLWLGRARLLREGGRNILAVGVGQDRVAVTIGLDNSGSRPIGPVQLDASVRISQLLAADDQLIVTGITVPTTPDEYLYGRLRYTKRVSHGGTELFGSISQSQARPGSYLSDRGIEGQSWTASMGVLHPLVRARAESLWLEGSFGVRTVRQDRFDRPTRRDRLSVARVGGYGFVPALGGRLRASATVSQGLDLFDATERNDPFASRRDADATFTTLALTGEWAGALAGPVSAQVAVASQFASQPLLVSEEVGLGGGAFLRGYDYGERLGDEGIMASGELRYALASRLGPLSKPQLYGFIDGGHVSNLDNGSGGGGLVSTGAGVRTAVGKKVYLDTNVAFPLSGERYDSGNDAPVLNFRITGRF
jgi:hemolysin activation/secretion protein